MYELFAEPPPMDRVLVLGLDGWIDAGAGGAQAMAALQADATTEVIAAFDSDALIDARARRPMVQLIDGVHDTISWPTIEVHAGTDRAGNGLLLLTGPEPDFRWRSFTEDVLDLAAELSVTMTVGFGAFPAPVPHTRPVRLADLLGRVKTDEAARKEFLDLLEVLGPEDPRTATWRKRLTTTLY